jgi:hypothetical protein
MSLRLVVVCGWYGLYGDWNEGEGEGEVEVCHSVDQESWICLSLISAGKHFQIATALLD